MRMLGAHEVCGAVETLSSSPLASHPTPAHPFALVLILCPRLTLPWYHYLVLCVHVRVWCCGGGRRGGGVAMLCVIFLGRNDARDDCSRLP